MNERIRELAEQQGFTGPNFYISSSELEKFAELIVRECAELANEETSLPYDSYSKKIKKHFGVEE
jgi:hypothetical protein